MRLPRPFAGIPNKREVWAWGMYDLANQSFTLLIITVLFPVYFRQVVVDGDAGLGDAIWSGIYAASQLLVVILAPLAGAAGDGRGIKKRFLVTTGLLCGSLTCALGLVGPSMIVLASAIFIVGNVAYQIGEHFLASFLPEISTSRNIGRISGIGWTMGYAGALALMVLVFTLMALFDLREVDRWRPFFVFAGLWFLAGLIPPALFLREIRPKKGLVDGRSIVVVAKDRLAETVRNAARFRQLVRFLTAFFVYGLGVQTMIAFAALIAQDFGFDRDQLVLFILQLTVTAGIAAALTSWFQDRIGARTTILIYLGVWIASTLAMIALTLPENPPTWLFWVIGNGIGLGLGGIGTASRSLVGRFTPKQKTAEFFGLWGMVYKFAGVIGVLSFGQLKAWLDSPVPALALLTLFFAAGLLLTLRVDEPAGLRAAKRAERDYDREGALD